MRLGPTVERMSTELGNEIDFFRLEVNAGNSDHWVQVREHFRIGPRLPLLSLFAAGRWQRSLQGPAPEEVVRPFILSPLGFGSDGELL